MAGSSSRATDHVDVDLVLDSGVVLDDYALDRAAVRGRPIEIALDTDLLLAPGASCRLEGDRLTVSFDVLPDDLSVREGHVSMARTRRSVDVHVEGGAVRDLVQQLASGCTLADAIAGAPEGSRETISGVVSELVGWGAVSTDRAAKARVAHEWSMRGANSRGHLSPLEIVDITFTPPPSPSGDGTAFELPPRRPLPVDSLTDILRRRRSLTSYDGSPISFDQLGQLLGHACGVTGELLLADRRLPLRAYPSPGALYAVNIDVIPTRVQGLPTGVFRYIPELHALATMHRKKVAPVSFCLPDVRTVVGGIAAFVALSMSLPRATMKYGNESYRILVAEAGCIAENLVLVAHALGLRAGPFTGVFDRLVDQAIGLEEEGSRFVLGVLIGGETEATWR